MDPFWLAAALGFISGVFSILGATITSWKRNEVDETSHLNSSETEEHEDSQDTREMDANENHWINSLEMNQYLDHELKGRKFTEEFQECMMYAIEFVQVSLLDIGCQSAEEDGDNEIKPQDILNAIMSDEDWKEVDLTMSL
ncbi:hypothetical protein AVEN_195874-1 [Araneus ventricosus]|uniref:Uncharacterized protein n=1 Tax=Araneus ventricosus TaxID=182803 RepID=A0A4Y2DWX5_ARAVE|nr:hypothetical protein AVEN_195874-1 [Araneus ventricosus]